MRDLHRLVNRAAWACMFVMVMSCTKDDMDLIPVSKITIEGEHITNGQSSQLTAVITPANASNKEVNWSVNDESIATISGAGLLTAVKNGNVQVTATAQDGSNVSASRWFNVSGVDEPLILVTSIQIIGDDITDGKSRQYQAEVLPVDATNKNFTWSVAPDSVASVSPTGLLTPKKNGQAILTATASDASGVIGQKTVQISGVPDVSDGVIVDNANDILSAIGNANPGDKIYIRGGTYDFSSTVRLTRSGMPGQLICLLAFPGDAQRPKFDFSSMSENSSNRGVQVSGDYWYVKQIDVFAAGDNGMFISGNHNLIEFCTFSENADTGLQLGNGATENTVVNCDSYYNADASIENADGFACKLDAGTGNKFIGCRAWQNLDDGWDGYLRGTDNITTTYENCWAFLNGRLKNGSISGGDGNGFKTGGSDDKLLKHNAVYTNCVAVQNVVDGFDHNSNRGEIKILNCTAHDNGHNINFGSGNIAAKLTIKNTVSFEGGSDSYKATVIDITNNSWQDGLTVTNADFLSIDPAELMAPRQPDGSLPEIQYLHLTSSSDLIDKGIDIGLPFSGNAPDLGAFERQ